MVTAQWPLLKNKGLKPGTRVRSNAVCQASHSRQERCICSALSAATRTAPGLDVNGNDLGRQGQLEHWTGNWIAYPASWPADAKSQRDVCSMLNQAEVVATCRHRRCG